LPWVRPVNNRLATASTTSWANRAIRSTHRGSAPLRARRATGARTRRPAPRYDPRAPGSEHEREVRRPSDRSPAWSSMSFTISRTSGSGGEVQGTIPAAARPTAIAPVTSAAGPRARPPPRCRGRAALEHGETPPARPATRSTSTAVPLTSARRRARAGPASDAQSACAHDAAGASGRSAAGRFTRSARRSQMSLST